MKEYIDKQKLLEELREELTNDCNMYNSHIEKEIRDKMYEFAIDVIEDSLPANVKEVVYAEWIDKMKCSKCGQIDWTRPHYCPNCGAEMSL